MLAPVGIGNRPMEICNIATCYKQLFLSSARLLDWILYTELDILPSIRFLAWHVSLEVQP